MEIRKNRYWDKSTPYVTVLTPVYNRRSTLQRTIDSVEKQSYRNFEYIIVNDGSTEDIDDIVEAFMNETDIPTLYIKKQNGGVHTARNQATIHGRGVLWANIDSDDELLPNALKILVDVWMGIPEDERKEFREVVALCMDENGKQMGKAFPQEINQVSLEMSAKMRKECGGEHYSINVMSIMKDNLWPEPEGINFVRESVLWRKLNYKYRSYCVNEIVRIYHLDSEDSLCRSKKININSLKAAAWNAMEYLDNSTKYDSISLKEYIKNVIIYDTFCHILQWKKQEKKVYIIRRAKNKFLSKVLWIPSLLSAKMYQKKHFIVM